MCDIWDQEDCPEGEKCTAYATMGSSWDAHKCVPVMGNDQWRDPCLALGENPGRDGLDSCAKGLMCWDVNEDGDGWCYEVCKGSPNNPLCPDDGICALYGNGIVNLCLPKCDPLAPQSDCFNPDNLCLSDPGGQGFVCVLNASQGMGGLRDRMSVRQLLRSRALLRRRRLGSRLPGEPGLLQRVL